MAELKVQLKQHTPIIHFQHDQEGATLRASELKPKLDKFLIEKFEKENIDYKKWLIGKGEHQALNYKVKILTDGNFSYYFPLPLKPESNKHPDRSNNLLIFLKKKFDLDINILAPTSFFANSDKIKFKKDDSIDENKTEADKFLFALFTNNDIKIYFNSWDEKIVQQLERAIVSFFLTHNFGSRQNKGFGSFTVKYIDGKEINFVEKKLNPYFIKKSKSTNTDFNKLFEFILSEYQLLKNGKGRPYKKSELFKYFINKQIIWEKRYIKQQINVNKILNNELFYDKKATPIDVDTKTSEDYNAWVDRQKNDYKYVRALLGLAEHFEFNIFAESEDKDGNSIKESFYDRNKKYLVAMEHKPKLGGEKIQRFPSPILFKIINGCVYLGINDSYKKILGEKFEFHLKLKGDIKDTEKNIGPLLVPDEFDLEDFIKQHLSNSWVNLK